MEEENLQEVVEEEEEEEMSEESEYLTECEDRDSCLPGSDPFTESQPRSLPKCFDDLYDCCDQETDGAESQMSFDASRWEDELADMESDDDSLIEKLFTNVAGMLNFNSESSSSSNEDSSQDDSDVPTLGDTSDECSDESSSCDDELSTTSESDESVVDNVNNAGVKSRKLPTASIFEEESDPKILPSFDLETFYKDSPSEEIDLGTVNIDESKLQKVSVQLKALQCNNFKRTPDSVSIDKSNQMCYEYLEPMHYREGRYS